MMLSRRTACVKAYQSSSYHALRWCKGLDWLGGENGLSIVTKPNDARHVGANGHAVLTVLLSLVEESVGGCDQRVRIVHFASTANHAKADGQGVASDTEYRPIVLSEAAANPFGGLCRALDRSIAQEDCEFLATEAHDHIVGTYYLLKDHTRVREHLITDEVTIRIIDFLEPVEIDHQQRYWSICLLGKLELSIEPPIKRPAVVQAGQGIRHRLPLGFFKEPSVKNCCS